MAVVKADGFGHGAGDVARTALGAGATRLGVTSLDEAFALRAAGLTAPMLSWLNPLDADWAARREAGRRAWPCPAVDHLARDRSDGARGSRAPAPGHRHGAVTAPHPRSGPASAAPPGGPSARAGSAWSE